VREHGGTLTYETTPGQGTTFRLRMPLAHREAPAEREFPEGRETVTV